MRKVIALTGVFCLLASAALAANGFDKQKVSYTVQPVVGFGSAALPLAGSGDPFTAAGLTLGAHFTPHANSQDVNMWVCATPLFKGDTPVNATGGPNPNNIPLKLEKPAVLSGTGFTPTPFDMPLINADTFAYDQYTWPRTCSAQSIFRGGSNNSFSNPVDVNVVWASSNTELPTGGYSGYIQLYVATIP